jgi:redox-sensitive bicupin YhaK (pirin superfamily)
MIALRRAEERHRGRRDKQQVWLTFYAKDAGDPLAGGFGDLEMLDEHVLPPKAKVPRQPRRAGAILTYVIEGSLSHSSSSGLRTVIGAGEFRYASVTEDLRVTESNPSGSAFTHLFQIRIRSSAFGPSDSQRRFSAAERRGFLRRVASPDPKSNSILIREDASIFSAMLDPGQHVVHELLPGRRAWVHLVHGAARLGDRVMTTGDGAGVFREIAVSLTAIDPTELLLIDVGDGTPEASRGIEDESSATDPRGG